MSEPSEAATHSAAEKKPIRILRERRGGVPRELIERSRQQRVIHKHMTEALRDGPKTVPELASQLDLPTHEALQYVMGMKKYGTVVEAEQVDGYFKYQLIDDSRATEAAL